MNSDTLGVIEDNLHKIEESLFKIREFGGSPKDINQLLSDISYSLGLIGRLRSLQLRPNWVLKDFLAGIFFNISQRLRP